MASFLRDATAGNHGHCSQHLGEDVLHFDEYNYHDSLQARVIEEIGQWITFFKQFNLG